MAVDSIYTSKATLTQLKDDFFAYLKKGEYANAQKKLHPNGVYFYTLGKILLEEFTLRTLQTKKGLLMGTYLSGGDGPAGNIIDSVPNVDSDGEILPKLVTGTYWLDSMLTNFSSSPSFHTFYPSTAYGNSGNYSSNHAIFGVEILNFDPWEDKLLFNNQPIIVMTCLLYTSPSPRDS